MRKVKRFLKVFLCYASQDDVIVFDLYKRLLGEGWIDPWLDKENLLLGQDYDNAIHDAIKSTDAVIAFISKDSVNKIGYVQKELRLVYDASMYRPIGDLFLIPLRLEDCTTPPEFDKLHWVDYFGSEKENTYQSLLESLNHIYERVVQTEILDESRLQFKGLEHKQEENSEINEKIKIDGEEINSIKNTRLEDSITGKEIIDRPVVLFFYKAKIDQTYVSHNGAIEVTTKTYKDFEPVKIVVDSKRYNKAQFFSKFSGGYGCLVSLLLPVIGIMLTVGIYYFFSDAPKNTFCALFLPTVFWSLGLYFLKYKKELATPEKILLRKYIDTLWIKGGIKKDEVLFTEDEYLIVKSSNKTITTRAL